MREGFTITRIQVKMLKALMLWIQDFRICQENYDFPDVITQKQFLNEVDKYLQRHGTWNKAVDTGKQMIINIFGVPLKKLTQWERWEQTLQDALVSIIDTNGVPVSYVIMELYARNYAGRGTWEEKFISTASLTCGKFLADVKTVHDII